MDWVKFVVGLVTNASVGALAVAVIGYFAKHYFEQRWKRLETRTEELLKTSLALTQDMRRAERDELVTYRVAIEKWEYFLETSLFDFSILSADKISVESLYEQDKNIFFEVRVAVVRASTYLRNKDLEIRLMAAVTELRKTYYPLITQSLPELIDIRTKLDAIAAKLKAFADSGMKDMTFAPTPQDQKDNLALQEQLTAAMRQFAEGIKAAYPPIAVRMAEVKDAINVYIYRRVEADALNGM